MSCTLKRIQTEEYVMVQSWFIALHFEGEDITEAEVLSTALEEGYNLTAHTTPYWVYEAGIITVSEDGTTATVEQSARLREE